MNLRRLPIESAQPVQVFAGARVALTVLALAISIVFGFPDRDATLMLLAGVALPWTVGILVVARRRPQAALGPFVVLGDFALLVGLELTTPDIYAPVRFAALFLVAVHAHFQGERRGLAVAVIGPPALILATALRGDAPFDGEALAVYEVVFEAVAVCTAILVGRLRTTESASRLQARRLSQRTIQAESETRRRVAESIHDGPVQELISLDMVLSAAEQAAGSGNGERSAELLSEARELTSRNIRALRDEIIDLGPFAFEQLGYGDAISKCMPLWKRRYDLELLLAIDDVELSPELAGGLFRITQEAVMNAGRHSGASTVSLSLRSLDGQVELRVADDGKGFGEVDPLAPGEPGHLGLASMRERAQLLDGELEIETSDRGTRVLVLAPLSERSADRGRFLGGGRRRSG